jgi:hypothetical protein
MSALQSSELFKMYTRYAQNKRYRREAKMRCLYSSGIIPVTGDPQLGYIAGVLSRFAGTQQTVFDNGSSGSTGSNSVNLMERQVQRALAQVMGRSASSPETFISALNDAFPSNGNGKITATPSRSVISLFGSQPQGTALSVAGLSGQISIEQANLYRQASIVVNDALLVLAGIQPFSPLVDLTQIETLRSLVRAEITTLLDEFGRVDEPRDERVDAYFNALRGLENSPKGGHLTEFGKTCLLDRSFSPATPATLADEAQIAAYELLQSYVNSLFDIWTRFQPEQDQVGSPLFSERLSRASVLLSVINGGNNNWMAAMDSIGFTEAERRSKATTLSLLQGYSIPTPGHENDLELPDMTVNDLNDWLDRFSTLEGPTIMSDSGQYGLEFVTDQADQLFWTVASIVGFIKTADMTSATTKPVLVQALLHERVNWALDDILNQLKSLADLAA